jgi:hypothetical protein
MSQDRCAKCTPFSPDVLALYRRIQGTQDPAERGELVLQLANKFADEYDASDDGFTETFHAVVDNYHQSFLNYNQSGLRLGRVLMHVLENHIETDEPTDGDTTLPKIQRVDPSVN